MKKGLFIGLIALLAGCNSVKENEFVIKGNIKNYPSDILICAYQQNGDFKLDTIWINNGKLSYKTQVTEPVVASLVSRDPNSNITLEQGIIPGESVTLFLEPGTVLNIDIDNARWPELQWQGGACNNDLMKLYAKTLPMKHEAFEYLRKTYVPGITEDEKAQAEQQRALLNGKAQEELIRFVKGNPSSYAALYLLGTLRNVLELNDYVATFNGFNPDLRATALGKEMQEKINTALRTEVGGTAPNFEKIDKDGNTIRLSDYRGKYVLLDFWGSWCGPCRASHPHLKALEAKYAPKGLVVINIASENGANARETWLQAIEEDGMTWTQILNNEGRENCDVVKEYAITAFPTKVLIGPDGKILVRAVGESEPIDQKLQEIFGE